MQHDSERPASGSRLPERKSPERLARSEHRVKIEAAKLRIHQDRRLGRETPNWVKKLADGQLTSSPRLSKRKSPERLHRSERRVKIEAAKLRIALDSRLGRQTPDWVKKLADENP